MTTTDFELIQGTRFAHREDALRIMEMAANSSASRIFINMLETLFVSSAAIGLLLSEWRVAEDKDVYIIVDDDSVRSLLKFVGIPKFYRVVSPDSPEVPAEVAAMARAGGNWTSITPLGSE